MRIHPTSMRPRPAHSTQDPGNQMRHPHRPVSRELSLSVAEEKQLAVLAYGLQYMISLTSGFMFSVEVVCGKAPSCG